MKRELSELIDLRSDTVTKPTKEMIEKMMSAEVGDMVLGEDPSVLELEEYVAALFGMDRALFCPSGTMTNQIAIKLQTNPGDEVICSKLAHIYQFEGGGIALHSGASVALIDTPDGLFTTNDIIDSINPDDPHKARTSMVSVENTANKGGGTVWDYSVLVKMSNLCKDRGLAFHLDGARIFNAMVATGRKADDFGSIFDTVSICLSKGLGAPVGSLLICREQHYHRALRLRRVMGGTMRQGGYLAAAGLYALKNNINRLTDDHKNAAILAGAFKSCEWIKSVKPVMSNIVIAECADGVDPHHVIRRLHEDGLRAGSMGGNLIRVVTHLHIDEKKTARAAEIISDLKL